MSFWNAVLFGLVQGITEFFPVSSSAHLSVLFNLFGITGAGYNAQMFSVFLHFGTLLAAVISFWGDFGEIFFQIFDFAADSSSPEKKTRRSYFGVRMLIMMLFASLPLAMLLPLNDSVNELFNSNLHIGVMLVLSGTIVYIAGQFREGKKTERNMEISDALVIGICQMVSAIPGISRTGTVMTACLAVGCSREFGVKFSVMLSAPVMLIANIIHAFEAASLPFSFSDVPLCLVGMAVSCAAGVISIRLLKKIIKNGRFNWFSYYSWVAGVIFIILTMIF